MDSDRMEEVHLGSREKAMRCESDIAESGDVVFQEIDYSFNAFQWNGEGRAGIAMDVNHEGRFTGVGDTILTGILSERSTRTTCSPCLSTFP
ncbi:hypothetical protein BD309DRAFT_974477 [Dichomitus squalens]|uniref:Uncharacterized protein n=1 Tax=Dichomitus squalens TaxID=114155 RepID=A0A4Q9PGH8_9APHY|nr:hypothetical protein BD309DRAFT_974477 [Dichomitus squalens]TBU51596.1 hypothetical protein BD310DRAFT_941942 [Dichomitus squalens]